MGDIWEHESPSPSGLGNKSFHVNDSVRFIRLYGVRVASSEAIRIFLATPKFQLSTLGTATAVALLLLVVVLVNFAVVGCQI
jgi:hypothetical protein